MIELEREQHRKTYLLARTGFTFLATALVIASLSSLIVLVSRLLEDPRLLNAFDQSPLRRWSEILIIWGPLIGTTLLWGRWDQPSWQRRSGLLLVMCLVDVIIWFMNEGDVQVVGEGPWLRKHLGEALGWAEFALIASLCGTYLVHLGLEQAEESAKSTRSLAATGTVVWMLLFWERTNWAAGWPLQPRMGMSLESWMLLLGFDLIWTITLIQVTALTIASVRQSTHVLREMDSEDQHHDLLRLPSESISRDENHHTLARTGGVG